MSGDIRPDHKLHYVSSYAIQQTAYIYTESLWKSAAISIGVGLAKELIHDKLMRRGNPSIKDMAFNTAGAGNALLFTIMIKL